jgi:hypothetical protein
MKMSTNQPDRVDSPEILHICPSELRFFIALELEDRRPALLGNDEPAGKPEAILGLSAAQTLYRWRWERAV